MDTENIGKKISAELDYLSVVNAALQVNAFPIVRELRLSNSSAKSLDKIECRFSSPEGIIQKKTIHVEHLEPGETLLLHDLNIVLNYQLLAELSEMLKGTLTLEIFAAEQPLFQQDFELTALAADQWTGAEILPEILAAFVTPNLEIVSQLQTAVADELKRATGNSEIQGYQADRKRVYEICCAIFHVIQKCGINYSNPAASFGVPGQRIRFADAICKYRLGTCLDTALLFASVMEACELHPVIMLQKSHAYIGCHLVDRYFPDIPEYDLQNIRKLADLDEFFVCETTMVTGNHTFKEAEDMAKRKHLLNESEFQYAIDIVRARLNKIQPLPIKHSVGGFEFESPKPPSPEVSEDTSRILRAPLDLDSLSNGEAGKISGRVTRWAQKLLDLSLRNRLLNVRDTKLVIPIVCPDISALEDKLAANESVSLKSLEDLLNGENLHAVAKADSRALTPEVKKLLSEELQQRRLWTPLTAAEVGKRLTALYRQGKTELEESGVNTLFAAFCFLEWKEPSSGESHFAPILLVPVQLRRKSIAEGIRISRLDEDTIINETLLELLRSQFKLELPELSSLPVDQSGVDVEKVMQIFRQRVQNMQGWEVHEDVKIGLFSFGKFVMWNDLTTRAEDLKKNPLVKHLAEGGGLYDDGIDVFPPEEIEQQLDLQNLFCPKSADSSQLTAVLYSALGKSFVLHGPPGTGKSQTITNIIAHNLAHGKKVLFVSEKKAALDVVHKRLADIGLRPFCLELHSNKSGKAEVLAQFSEALNVSETKAPKEWTSCIASLKKLQKELNGYVKALHKIYPNGFSAYDCFSRLMSKSNVPNDLLDFDCLAQTEEEYSELQQQVMEFAMVQSAISPESIKALTWLNPFDWNPAYERNLCTAAQQLVTKITALQNAFSAYCTLFDFPKTSQKDWIVSLADASSLLRGLPDVPKGFLEGNMKANLAFVKNYSTIFNRLIELNQQLKCFDFDIVRTLDIDGIAERLCENEKCFVLSRFFKNRALLKELAGLKKVGGKKLSVAELSEMLPLFSEWIRLFQQCEGQKSRISSILGTSEPNIDLEKLDSIAEKVIPLWKAIQEITCDDPETQNKVLAKFCEILPGAEKFFAAGTRADAVITEFLQAKTEFYDVWNTFLVYADSFQYVTDISCAEQQLLQLLEYRDDIRGVMCYIEVKNRLSQGSLHSWVQAANVRTHSPQEAKETFEIAYMQKMLEQLFPLHKELANFNGLTRREQIRKFSELDKQYTDLVKKIIFARLAAKLPCHSISSKVMGIELGILKHECAKKARQIAVRQLLAQIHNIVFDLKPCFLMSPLSVAQYLPPDAEPFDLIVFDEASQIPVWDAIGVIARGKQLIVVGDPKQMPPTNFFQKTDNPETEEISTEVGDLESILDKCIAADLHSCYLNWHYRSKHESLISFSNHYYYEDRLFTFPAASQSPQLGIGFQFVPEGVYGRCGSRSNIKEAEALVQYVFEKLEASTGRKRSIGIVTFSEAQKNLIEDLLENERPKHPSLESYFSDQNEEPLFVKNLENVQGDERDVILFSICYAPPAKDQKLSMNFGPLNRQGGERRLNVAITRAKEQVIVFSSIHSTQIDLNRTNAEGAKHLKSFLDYAENGIKIQHNRMEENAVFSGTAEVVSMFLKENGYAVDRNVGCSGYRIDIAVRNPEDKEEYLLAIECDGNSYAAQRTVRDRDHLRPSVLQSLGWHTWQAWSVDWMYDRKHAEAALLAELEKIRKHKDVDTPTPKVQKTLPVTEPEPEVEMVPEKKVIECYRAADLICFLPQELFYDGNADQQIKEQISRVIEQEAPICEKVLKKRIMKAWNFNRMGDNIQAVLDACIPTDLPVTSHPDGKVYWKKEQNPSEYLLYRSNGDLPENKRTIDEIPLEELANAMLKILTDYTALKSDSLFRETLKCFGFSAVTTKARKYLKAALELLKKNGNI